MADLRAWLTDLGYTDVRTLLQSGNAVFSSSKRPATVQRELEARLADGAGFSIHCGVGPPAETRSLVSFRRAAPKKPDFAADAFAPELFHLGGQEIYFWVPDGSQNSKVLAAFPTKKGEVATVRNWNTVTKLLAMTEG